MKGIRQLSLMSIAYRVSSHFFLLLSYSTSELSFDEVSDAESLSHRCIGKGTSSQGRFPESELDMRDC